MTAQFMDELWLEHEKYRTKNSGAKESLKEALTKTLEFISANKDPDSLLFKQKNRVALFLPGDQISVNGSPNKYSMYTKSGYSPETYTIDLNDK